MRARSDRPDREEDFEDWLERGQECLMAGDDQGALAAFDAASALKPGNLMVLGFRASSLTSLGRFEESITAFSELIERDPDGPAGYSGRAGALSELSRERGASALGPDDVRTALSDFAKAYRLDDAEGRELIHYLRGCFLEQIGEFAEAVEDLEAAVKLRPAAPYLAHLANARFQSGDPEGGADAVRTMVDMLGPFDDDPNVTPPPAPLRPPTGRA